MKPSGAHTHPGSGGPGLGLAVIIVLVLLVAGSAGAALHTAEHALDLLVHIVLVVLAVAAGTGLAGLGICLLLRRRYVTRTEPWTVQVESPARAPQRAVEAAAQHALPPPQIHLHLHGPVSAADVAQLIARQGNPQPAIEEDQT